MSPSPLHGEVEERFNGKVYRLRLTLGALAALEARLGMGSLLELIERFEQGRFTTTELIAILTAGLRGAGHEVSEEQVAAFTHERGIQGFVETAARLLAAAFPEPQEADN